VDVPESFNPHPYDRHVGRYGRELAVGLIEFAAIKRGQRALDVGCGTGQLTAELASVLGVENVAAVDVSDDMLAACRARVPGAEIHAASAEALPFADGAFDAALAQLVVNLVGDPPGAVREMARVVRPGSVVAACFWDDDEMPLLRSLWDSIEAIAPEALADVGEAVRVGLPDLGLMPEWWAGAGLRDIAVGELEVSADYESFDDLWAPFEDGVGNSGRVYRSLTGDQRAAVRADAHRRLEAPANGFRLTARARTVRGQR